MLIPNMTNLEADETASGNPRQLYDKDYMYTKIR